MAAFGQPNPSLQRAIRATVKGGTQHVQIISHALLAMDDDGFDVAEVPECLRKGVVYGPEVQRNQLRANVVHRGIRIRVVVGGLDKVNGDWSLLERVVVVTVMETS